VPADLDTLRRIIDDLDTGVRAQRVEVASARSAARPADARSSQDTGVQGLPARVE
jgi:hypothetical protein